MKENQKNKCNHLQDQECKCICHEEYKIIIHDHACCSECFDCGFKVRCKHCTGDLQKSISHNNNSKLIIPSFYTQQSEETNSCANNLPDISRHAKIDVKEDHTIDCGWHQDWHNCTCGAFDKK